MNNKQKHHGFSLTEVLIAVGILAVGMVFVAGVFPAGIYLTTIATERTIAAVAADEAFAKVRIYGVDLASGQWPVPPTLNCVDFNDVSSVTVDPLVFEYPSVATDEPNQYCWSALCRRTDMSNNSVQVLVFVSRKTGPNLNYPNPSDPLNSTVDWPRPVKIGVSGGGNELTIDSGYETFINDGYTIVDNVTGRIYRVLERYKPPNDAVILLDRNWDDKDWQGNPNPPSDVWVVPPPVGGGRCPCIVVYPTLIGF